MKIMRFLLLALLSGTGLWAEVAAPSLTALPDGRVELRTSTAGAIIRYTFEDKDPDRSAGVYLAPVFVPAGRSMRVRAFSADGAEASSTTVVEQRHAINAR